MSGRNRQFRKKRDDGQTGNDADAPAPTPGHSIPAAGSAKEKDRKRKKVSLLSFDDEEGPSPIKIKASIKERSKSKLKPNLGGLRLAEELPKPVSSQQSQAGKRLFFTRTIITSDALYLVSGSDISYIAITWRVLV